MPEVADTLRSGSGSAKAHGKVNGTDRVTLVPTFWNGEQVTQTLDAVLAKGQTMPEKNRFPAVPVPATTHTLKAEGFDASEDGTGRGVPLVPCYGIDEEQNAAPDLMGCLKARTLGGGFEAAVAFNDVAGTLKSCGGKSGTPNGAEEATRLVGAVAYGFQDDTTPKVRTEGSFCLRRDAGGEGACVMTPAMQVRRLLPVETERLQGFPDDHTLIPWRKKPASECPDGPRYKAIGNSMAVPVMNWIGRRINLFMEGTL